MTIKVSLLRFQPFLANVRLASCLPCHVNRYFAGFCCFCKYLPVLVFFVICVPLFLAESEVRVALWALWLAIPGKYGCVLMMGASLCQGEQIEVAGGRAFGIVYLSTKKTAPTILVWIRRKISHRFQRQHSTASSEQGQGH